MDQKPKPLGFKYKDVAEDIYDKEVTDALRRANDLVSRVTDKEAAGLAAATSYGHLHALRLVVASAITGLRYLSLGLAEEDFDMLVGTVIEGYRRDIEDTAKITVKELRALEAEDAQEPK